MKKWIDLKSLVISGVLVLSVMYVLGATPTRPAPAGPVQRFALVHSNLPGGEAFVLDTVTGEVWPRQGRGGSTNAFYSPKLKTQTPDEPNESRL